VRGPLATHDEALLVLIFCTISFCTGWAPEKDWTTCTRPSIAFHTQSRVLAAGVAVDTAVDRGLRCAPRQPQSMVVTHSVPVVCVARPPPS